MGAAEYLEKDLAQVREIIRRSLSSDIDLLDRTNESLISRPGKMMRPSLALLMAKACSGGKLTDDSYSFAAAAELLHNATLLHDDVADNSPSRRGRPTVMSLLGDRAAVLLGDFWLVKAMDRILDSKTHDIEGIRCFAKTLSDLAEGEMLQLQKASSCDTVEEDYYRIIYNKTASLFEAAAVTAALSVDAPKEYTDAAREYAVNLGIAFQIKDDIFDYDPSAQIGKPVGHDLLEQKITLPLLGALANAPGEESAAIRSMVARIQDNPSLREEIVAFVEKHDGMAYAQERLDEYVAKAVSSLDVLPDGEDKDYLVWLARYSAGRKI